MGEAAGDFVPFFAIELVFTAYSPRMKAVTSFTPHKWVEDPARKRPSTIQIK